MDSTVKTRLESLLHQIQLLVPASGSHSPSTEVQRAFKNICKLIFDEKAYKSLWDEHTLSLLDWLFQVKPPESTMFGDQLDEIRERRKRAQRINDLFFGILDLDASVEKVFDTLNTLFSLECSLLNVLKSSGRLEEIRDLDVSPSDKISSFLDFLHEDIGLDIANDESVKGCLEALKAKEGIGIVNTLLVKSDGQSALMLPLQIQVQHGSGQVHQLVHAREDFGAVFNRVRLALIGQGFLREADDILFTLELTEPEYLGTSLGLAAAVGMYGAARRMVIDPYTSFTGDINFDRGCWRVQAIRGLSQKIKAARLAGCRRLFIPLQNVKEVEEIDQESLQVIPVDGLLDVFLKLQVPTQPLAGDSLQVRKIDALRAHCQDQGWDLSPPRQIQNGQQFQIAPLLLPKISINIYNTGTHVPKQDDHPEFQELLKIMQQMEESRIPLRKIEQPLNIQNPSLRSMIRESLEQLQPTEQRQELYCEYSFKFIRGKELLVVKQYQKGTLQIQGTAGELYKAALNRIIPVYNLHYPSAQLSVEALLQPMKSGGTTSKHLATSLHTIQEIPLPHIGTDESGKGDFFGPMVVGAVLVDAQTKTKLEASGVKDSKLLSDKRCRELAAKIREICRGKYEEVEIPPERYNELYESFKKEGKNLNHLLAWGHARAIESLLKRHPCSHAVADQFGDEHYILSRLMEKGKRIQLIQIPKGERDIAVAAASILTRDIFLARLERLGQEYQIELPKGASEAVVIAAKQVIEKRGKEDLRKLAKLHHKTTQKIVGEQ
jgi:ribonuclease HIII